MFQILYLVNFNVNVSYSHTYIRLWQTFTQIYALPEEITAVSRIVIPDTQEYNLMGGNPPVSGSVKELIMTRHISTNTFQ